MTRATSAAAGDFAALMEEVDTLFPKETHYEVREAAQKWLLGLWIARDANVAAEYVAGKKDEILGSAFGLVLGSVAPRKVAAILKGPLKEALGKYFPTAVLRALSESDPREYLKLDANDSAGYVRALKTLAVTDPLAASEAWLQGGVKAPGGKDALNSLVAIWLARDPGAARRWADALKDPEARRLAQHAWLGALAKKDVQAARRELAGMEMGEWLPGTPGGMDEPALQYPQDARMIVLAALARENLPAALAEMDVMVKAALGGPQRPGDDGRTQRGLAAKLRVAIVDAAAAALPNDPGQLLSALNGLTSDGSQPLDAALNAELRQGILQKKMGEWDVSKSLEAVRLLAGSLVPADRRSPQFADNVTLSSLLQKAVSADAEATVSFVATLPEAQRMQAAGIVFESLHGDCDTRLLARAAALIPADGWTNRMGERLAQSPQEFAGLVAGLPTSVEAGLTRQGFAQSWARQDPEAAAQWVTALPPDRGTMDSARGITDAWARYDDTAASAWAQSLPPGQTRDGAALGLAAAVAATEPEGAWQWAASNSDGTLSADAFRNVARQWGTQAPPEFREAFSAALDRGGYGGEIKAKALSALDRSPAPASPIP